MIQRNVEPKRTPFATSVTWFLPSFSLGSTEVLRALSFSVSFFWPPSWDRRRTINHAAASLSLSLLFICYLSLFLFIFEIFSLAHWISYWIQAPPPPPPLFFKQKNFEPPQGVGASPYPKRKFTKKKQKKNKKIRLMKTLFEITIATRSNRNPLRSNYEQDLLSDRQKLKTQQQNPVNSVKLSETRGHL